MGCCPSTEVVGRPEEQKSLLKGKPEPAVSNGHSQQNNNKKPINTLIQQPKGRRRSQTPPKKSPLPSRGQRASPHAARLSVKDASQPQQQGSPQGSPKETHRSAELRKELAEKKVQGEALKRRSVELRRRSVEIRRDLAAKGGVVGGAQPPLEGHKEDPVVVGVPVEPPDEGKKALEEEIKQREKERIEHEINEAKERERQDAEIQKLLELERLQNEQRERERILELENEQKEKDRVEQERQKAIEDEQRAREEEELREEIKKEQDKENEEATVNVTASPVNAKEQEAQEKPVIVNAVIDQDLLRPLNKSASLPRPPADKHNPTDRRHVSPIPLSRSATVPKKLDLARLQFATAASTLPAQKKPIAIPRRNTPGFEARKKMVEELQEGKDKPTWVVDDIEEPSKEEALLKESALELEKTEVETQKIEDEIKQLEAELAKEEDADTDEEDDDGDDDPAEDEGDEDGQEGDSKSAGEHV